jgi:hypothetical protein
VLESVALLLLHHAFAASLFLAPILHKRGHHIGRGVVPVDGGTRNWQELLVPSGLQLAQNNPHMKSTRFSSRSPDYNRFLVSEECCVDSM